MPGNSARTSAAMPSAIPPVEEVVVVQRTRPRPGVPEGKVEVTTADLK